MPVSRRFIAAAPEAVFAVLTDAASYPQWLVGAKHILTVDPSWPEAGSEFRHEVGAGPVQTRDRTTVEDIDPDHSLDLVVRARPFLEADVHFGVRAQASGSQLTMAEEPRGRFRLLAGVISPLIKLRNDRSLERLASLVEAHP